MVKSILVFGAAVLQKSIIERCKTKGLFVVGIDPDANASERNLVDAFEVVDGQNYEQTLAVAQKYNVSGVITAATDKPLIMMARVAEKLCLPFYSVQTAEWATDKSLMKTRFLAFDIPCANGLSIQKEIPADINLSFPLIVKPIDNSGSRGVIYCKDTTELRFAVSEAFNYTRKDNILLEEYVDGDEYSVEAIHLKGKSYILQITKKITTHFPYNVELGHVQPADLSEELKEQIAALLDKIAVSLAFENCASHTELKIGTKGITIIETSPRLGGDFITSTLVPLSTGINMEDLLIDISIGVKLSDNHFLSNTKKNSAILYFQLSEGEIVNMDHIGDIINIDGVIDFYFGLKVGDKVNKITSSLNRYGHVIIQKTDLNSINEVIGQVKNFIQKTVILK